MIDRLELLRRRDTRWVVGLNAGTSLDGIDAVLLRVSGQGFETRFEPISFATEPIPPRSRERLLRMESLGPNELAALDVEIGEAFANAARSVAGRRGGSPNDIDLIGSHGITVAHNPPSRPGDLGSTLQIGNLSVIAERTSSVVVGDFRSADMAVGGQGAPLIAYLDYLLYRERPGSILLNLGGIANLTFVSGELEETIAFDAGPANLPLNALAQRLSQGHCEFDPDGKFAAEGHVDSILLDHLLQLPYLHRQPPKTTGREDFGSAWVEEILGHNGHLKLVDILATITAFVAEAVARSAQRWLPVERIRRVVVSGGGVHNLTLMNHLRRRFEPVPVEGADRDSIDPDAKEAILFALLANDRLFDRPTNLPSVTGARWPVRLGSLVY